MPATREATQQALSKLPEEPKEKAAAIKGIAQALVASDSEESTGGSSSENAEARKKQNAEVGKALVSSMAEMVTADPEAPPPPPEVQEAQAEAMNTVLQKFGNDLPPEAASEAANVLDTLAENAVETGEEVPDAQLGNLLSSAATLTVNIESDDEEEVDSQQEASQPDSAESTAEAEAAKKAARAEAAKTSKKVVSAVDKISQAATNGLKEGGPPRVIEVKGIKLAVAKTSPAQIQNGFSHSGFVVPPLGNTNARRAQECSKSGSGTSVQHTNWKDNPYAFAGAGEMDVKGKVQSFSLKSCGSDMKVSNLEEPIRFFLVRSMDMNESSDQVSERDCAFWDDEALDWKTDGCEVDEETTNFTHVGCKCTHLTSFSASAKKAACKFCKVSISKFGLDKPHLWIKQRWNEPGIWVLLAVLSALYMPCILVTWKDSKDWKRIAKNQKAYFKDKLNGGDTFKCMCFPGFRVCFGFFMCAPTFVQCPPPCCRKRKPKDSKKSSAGAVESEWKFKLAQKKKSEAELATALNLVRQATKQNLKDEHRFSLFGNKQRKSDTKDLLHLSERIRQAKGIVSKISSWVLNKTSVQKVEQDDPNLPLMLHSCRKVAGIAKGNSGKKLKIGLQAVAFTSVANGVKRKNSMDNTSVEKPEIKDKVSEKPKTINSSKNRELASMSAVVPCAIPEPESEEETAKIKAPKAGRPSAPTTDPGVMKVVPMASPSPLEPPQPEAEVDIELLGVLPTEEVEGAKVSTAGKNGVTDQVDNLLNGLDGLYGEADDKATKSVANGSPPVKKDVPEDTSSLVVQKLENGIYKPPCGTVDGVYSASVQIQTLMRSMLARRLVKKMREARGNQTKHVEVTVALMCMKGERKLMLAGPQRVFLSVKSKQDLKKRKTVDVFLTNEGKTSTEVTLAWEYWPQMCAKLPKNILFGQFYMKPISANHVPSVAGAEVFLQIYVSAGVQPSLRWDTQLSAPVVNGSCTWASPGQWFYLWRSGGLPKVVVEIEAPKQDEPDKQTVGGFAALCLPQDSFEGVLEVPVQHVFGRSNDAGFPGTNRLTVQAYDVRPEIASHSDTVLMKCSWHPSSTVTHVPKGYFNIDAITYQGNGTPRLRLNIDGGRPEVSSQILVIDVPQGGVDFSIHQLVDWTQPVGEQAHTQTLVSDAAATMKLASRIQYHSWTMQKLTKVVGKREHPLCKLWGYNPMITRKQRLGVLTSAILFGVFICCLLFPAPCLSVPKPAACQKKKSPWWKKFFSWDIVFATAWGIVLSTPIPFTLLTLFKKRVVLYKKTDKEKAWFLKAWTCQEKFAWLLVAAIHSWCILFLINFVRYYPWPLVQKWVMSVIMSLITRLVYAPAVRAAWMLILLQCSRMGGCCDICVASQEKLTMFPPVKEEMAPTEKVQTKEDDDDDAGDDEGDQDDGDMGID
eukprot:gnl/MRDRNA2_/MRDRNA2_32776_c0_seq1.p1 gnl/MRDRNA2_/MRDRNA2_32776_c0~~gnl/MRDRNA2_/MRDRNA2_32776_c0_seq1.p1  ORF type:complete len:1450 (-),score=314.45 gnl/MRDRNA2_/MRDRNA2_32776_c0_seq1:205-4449(-)